MLSLVRRRETLLLLLLLLTVLAFSLPASPWRTSGFLDAGELLAMGGRETPAGLMALPLTLLVVAGQIDLSVDGILAMAAIIFAVRWSGGMNVWPAALVALGAGGCGGLINGLLVAGFRRPSLAVTACTYILFRGLGFLVLGTGAVDLTNAPGGFLDIGGSNLGSTPVPEALLLFVPCAVVFGLLLHRSEVGPAVYAMGQGEAPVRTGAILTGLFVVSGVVSALAGLVMASGQGSVRADIGSGLVLDAVAAVMLGGGSVFGGTGTVGGTVLGLTVIAVLRGGLGLLGVSSLDADLVVACLLILAVLVPGQGQRSHTSDEPGAENVGRVSAVR